jgi:hypothetical protein
MLSVRPVSRVLVSSLSAEQAPEADAEMVLAGAPTEDSISVYAPSELEGPDCEGEEEEDEEEEEEGVREEKSISN